MSVLDMFKLDGKVAVVTGGGKGIGRGIVLALAEAGADVAIAARNQEEIEAVAAEVEALGRKAIAVPTDVTNVDHIDRLAELTLAKLGSVDVWVNNAGGLPDGTPRWLTRTSPEEWDAQINLNLKAVFLGCVAAQKAMGDKGGSIINISSSASRGGNMKNGPYGASKAAVNNLTNSFSNEMAPRVRVNAVAPGPIATQDFIDSMKMTTPEREEELKGMMNLPMDRFGEPVDIGAAVLFMASPASSWVTGQTIFVTGGS